MKDHHTTSESHEAPDPIEARMQQQRRDRRVFGILLFATTLVMSVFFGYFSYLERHAVTLDLRLAADDAASPGDQVLIHAEVVDAQSGKVQHVSGVQLERWKGDERIDRWSVDGVLRRAEKMDDDAMIFRLVREGSGPLTSTAELVVERGTPAAEAERRGGLYPALGVPGVRRVRTRDACDRSIDLLMYGGVPVANVRSAALVRVQDGDGQPVPDAKIKITTDGRDTTRATTDADGLAEATLLLRELGYVEIETACGAGESYAGFEAQPAYDGIGVVSWTQSEDGVEAEIVDSTQHQDAQYDVRCDGVLRDFGDLAPTGKLSLSKAIFDGVSHGAACRLQLYRGRVAMSAPHAVRVFRWGAPSLAWDWSEQTAGVGLMGLASHARSMDADTDVIAAWKRAGYARIRAGIATMLALSMLLWFALVVWGLRRRRFASSAADELEDERPPTTVAIGAHPMLWSGWVAILVAYGGLYVVLWLMGL